MIFSDVNYLAIFVGSVIYMAIGMLWYSPSFFGKKWSELTGLRSDAMKGGVVSPYVWTFIASLVMFYALNILMKSIFAVGLIVGAKVGLLVGLGFVATNMLGDILFLKRPVTLWLINAGYPVFSLIIVGALFGIWQ
jgi:uncharacterized protein YebE (UPF0316 family)